MSMSRHCDFYLAVDGKWYMELADDEYAGRSDSTTYGPFESYDQAASYLDQNFSNPGGWGVDESGKHPVPKKSPNGEAIKNPNSRRW